MMISIIRKTRLPRYFWVGDILTLFYTLILCFVSYTRFKRSIFALPAGEAAKTETPVLKFNRGQYRVLLAKANRFKQVLFNVFSGRTRQLEKSGYTGKIFLEGKDMVKQPVKGNFLYLCHPRHIPAGVKAGDLVELLTVLLQLTKEDKETYYAKINFPGISGKRFGQLTDLEKEEILLSLAEVLKWPFYLIDNITRDMGIETYTRLKKALEEISGSGSLVVHLAGEMLVVPQRIEGNKEYSEAFRWAEVVDTYSGLNEDEAE